MTRHIKPPKHPVTGHPYVDNALRNAWREHRDYLRAMPPLYTLIGTGATDLLSLALMDESSTSRKGRKHLRKAAYTAAFRYHPATSYTPRKVIL